MGCVSRSASRSAIKTSSGSGRLLTQSINRKVDFQPFLPSYSAKHRPVCYSKQHSFNQLYQQASQPRGSGSGYVKNRSIPLSYGLRQPPLENNNAFPNTSNFKPTFSGPTGCPPLGVCALVAPTRQAVRDVVKSHFYQTQGRNVLGLSGEQDACHEVEVSLPDCVRKIFPRHGYSSQAIEIFLSERKMTLKRYERAFRCVLGEMLQTGVEWEEASLPNWASCIISLSRKSLSQAKNAYSALMLFPTLSML
jgi:hypothetical protein